MAKSLSNVILKGFQNRVFKGLFSGSLAIGLWLAR